MGLMLWEFEVVVDRGMGNPMVPYQTYLLRGENDDAVRATVKKWGDGIEIKSVTPLRPYLDQQRAFSYGEACYYIGRCPSGEMISDLQAKGVFPKPVDGRPKPIPRRMLDDYLYGLWGSRPPEAA